jgi:hypothetical protein
MDIEFRCRSWPKQVTGANAGWPFQFRIRGSELGKGKRAKRVRG